MSERAKYHQHDPRGLIHEAYRMDIGAADARSIFFDWAMGAAGDDLAQKVEDLIAHYVDANQDHPMSAVLLESRGTQDQKRRRGGRAARVSAP